MLNAAQDKAGEFYRQFHYSLFSYISHRIPEISDELFRIDDAMMAGFGWEIGAFETWDLLGVAKTVEAMKAAGFTVAPWVDEMLASGVLHFIKLKMESDCIMIFLQNLISQFRVRRLFIILNNYNEKTSLEKQCLYSL